MKENLSIIQEILMTCIKINQLDGTNAEFDFHANSNTLTVGIGTKQDMQWYEGLTRRWVVAVKNTNALKAVLNEVKALDADKDDLLG